MYIWLLNTVFYNTNSIKQESDTRFGTPLAHMYVRRKEKEVLGEQRPLTNPMVFYFEKGTRRKKEQRKKRTNGDVLKQFKTP
jgi:hypothetical protein